jgi:processive 1,2-diacylglycerol beta-glucosyltransferase
VKSIDATTLEFKLARLLADPARLAAMGEAARRIARPDAAQEVLALIFPPA